VGHRVINPWTWQDQFGFAQAIEVTGSERALFCAGQTSTDADGNPLHPGDMRAQVGQALDNLETVLHEAGVDLSQVIRLNTYTTDVDALLGCYDVITSRLAAAGCRPSATLLGVARLAYPEYLVELEATAVA
jgi:enamine deaminase RidA (YjgF/YER057c/UK114 family)